MGPSQEIVLILSTVPPEKSEALAKVLLDRRLAACVNIMPVRSYYHWKDDVCEDQEHLLIAKTTKTKADRVIAAIKVLHPYELPEIIALPVIAGFTPYLEWVYQETRDDA
jgi:periplasmic divalent cation tolerance protein